MVLGARLHLLLGAMALTITAAASAEDAAALAATDGAEREAPVRITIGADTIQPGATRYPVRSTVAGSGLMVSFSSTPVTISTTASVRAPFAGLPAQLPVGGRLTSGFCGPIH